MANRDWLKGLEIDSVKVPTLRLAPLTIGAVEALLKTVPASTRAADTAFAKALHAESEGDPFYLKFLIEDLAALPAPSLQDVGEIPPKLNDYLDRRWDDVATQVKAEKSVRDLLCYLVVGLGPIRRDDLVEISNDDALDSFAVDDAVRAVKRYVIGSDQAGYSLCHPRFRDYLVTNRIRPSDQRPYVASLTKWCASAWPDESVRYPVEHVIAHLAAARDRAVGDACCYNRADARYRE